MTPEVACQEINRFCSSLNNGQVTLKETHSYYYLVQGQLAVTKLPWCDFLIWTPHGTSLQRIERDENLWKSDVFETQILLSRIFTSKTS